MRTAIFVLALATCACSAESNDRASAKDTHEICKVASQLAAKVMEARQSGVAMAAMMDTAQDDTPTDEASRILIQDAYQRPRWETQERQQREIENFANEAYQGCTGQ